MKISLSSHSRYEYTRPCRSQGRERMLKLSFAMPNSKQHHHRHVHGLAADFHGRSFLRHSLCPGYHFLPQSNWMNDPNGPFYDSSTGYHHLFYQYLTPRTWGHAISVNLIDWEILPTALNYTDVPYTQVPGQTPGVYSGSATFLLLSASTPTSENIWIMKYSIGPGASYDLPWGSPGPRDYYLTGTYSPETNLIEFVRDPIQWDAAMNRSTLLAFDVGAFYASKSVYLPEVGRILWLDS
jgi:hypothetical protein